MIPEIHTDPHKELIKEQIISAIKRAPISHFECDNRLWNGFLFEEIDINTLKTYQTAAVYCADFAKKTEDMIFYEIKRIIHNSNITSLYVLNRQQIVEALNEYTEKNSFYGGALSAGNNYV